MSLTKEELEKARAEMDRALLPKDQNGFFNPVDYLDEPARTELYAHQEPRPDGSFDPMFLAEDFANNNRPQGFSYQPGHMAPGTTWDSNIPQANVIFENPILNLSPVDQFVLRNARRLNLDVVRGNEVLTNSAEPSEKEMLRIDNTSVPNDMPELPGTANIKLYVTALGTFAKTAQRDIRICNFTVEVDEHRLFFERDTLRRDELMVSIGGNGVQHQMTINAGDVSAIVDRIQRKYPSFYVLPEGKRYLEHFINRIRDQIGHAPVTRILTQTGFQEVGPNLVYVHDGIVSPVPGTVFQTGKHIFHDTNLTPVQAFHTILELKKLSPRLELIIPLVLLMHLGPVFSLFDRAGCVPRFVTFLNGTTGSLKTATALTLFRIFQEQTSSPERTFNDTITAIEIGLGEANDRVLVLDDYQPPVSASTGKLKLEKLESVIRFVGDRVGKNRSNAELGHAKVFLPSGCCFITGEDTGGSQSSLLRALVLTIRKGDIDGRHLRHYQEHPELISTHLFYFLDWAGKNAAAVIALIADRFPKERFHFEGVATEKRLIDTGATLAIVMSIMQQYGVAIGGFSMNEERIFEMEWRAAIVDAIRHSEMHSRSADPVAMWCRAVFEAVEAGRLPLASCKESYYGEKFVGCMDGNTWWLRQQETYLAVCKFWEALGTRFPLTAGKIHERLAAESLILTRTEQRGGKNRTLYVHRGPGPSRPQMLRLDIQAAHTYLDSKGV